MIGPFSVRRAGLRALQLCKSCDLAPASSSSRQVRGIANEASTTKAVGRRATETGACGDQRPGIWSRSFCRCFTGFRNISSASGGNESLIFAAGSSTSSSKLGRYLAYAVLFGASGLVTYYTYPGTGKRDEPVPEVHTLTNWSGTHQAKTRVYFEPETVRQLEGIVDHAQRVKQRIRPVGSGLSPNGIGLSDEGMVNLALLDKVVLVDSEKHTVTVQAGARVEQVVEALRPHGLTLQNFASIKEQQIGGFIQVGAHGTGSHIPPVDEQVVSLKLVTPGKGMLHLSAESDPHLFRLARCGLGALGIVAEVTLQCVPSHQLVEHTFVTNAKTIKKKHTKWLRENKHMRYMWIPDTDAVVVVQCNPLSEGKEPPTFKSSYPPEDALKPARDLFREVSAKYGQNATLPEGAAVPLAGARVDKTPTAISEEELQQLSFTELRDKLIAVDPLNRDHIVRVNKAEAEYWKRSEGYRVGWSDQILGFDCGGQQWVSEVCFHTGTVTHPDTRDLTFMRDLLHLIQKERIPAPAPIEQRWTARSSSPFSPAFDSVPECIFSWVGIINYLPTADDAQRAAITKKFFEYRKVAQDRLWDRYNAYEHWAKIEIPEDEESILLLRERLRRRFPVEEFNKARKELDPNNILSNTVIDQLFPQQ